MINKLLYFSNYLFIFLFFPSFITGVFMPNLVCVTFVTLNLIFNFDKLKKIFLNNLYPFYFFLFFYFIIVASSVFSNQSLHSLESSFFYFLYYIYCLSLIILFSNSINFRALFFLCGILTCLILSLDAIYELFNGTNTLGFSSIEGRIAGLFSSRWVLGRYLVYILPILIGIYFLENEKLKRYRNLFFITVLLTSIVILFSGERAAFIMFFIYLFLLLSFFINKLSVIKILQIISLLIILFCFPFLFSETSERLRDNFIIYLTSNNYEQNQYLSMFVTSWKMFIENPIIGIGPNNFRYLCSDPIYYVSKWSCSTHPHSITFQLLAETGIIGFFTVYSLFAYFLYKSFKLLRSNFFSHTTFGMFSLQCSLIIYLFPLMITGNFFLSWYGFIYFLPISLFIVYSNRVKLNSL